MAEIYDKWSPYNYGADNPVYYVDKDGRFIGTLIGVAVGGLIGGVSAAIHHENVWKGAGKGAIAGGAAGAVVDITVATAGTGTLALVAAGGLSGAAGSVTGQLLDHGSVSLKETAFATGLGLGLGYLGAKLAPAVSSLFASKVGTAVPEMSNATSVVVPEVLPEEIPATNLAPKPEVSETIHAGKQGKHIIGHNNYIQGKSVLTVDAQSLLDQFHAGNVNSVQAIDGVKTRVDFGQVIGNYVDPTTNTATPTTNGIIINSNTGAHIVPARP